MLLAQRNIGFPVGPLDGPQFTFRTPFAAPGRPVVRQEDGWFCPA